MKTLFAKSILAFIVIPVGLGFIINRAHAETPKASAAPASTSLKYRKDGNTYFLFIPAGQSVIETLTAFANKENIQAANFNAIGAVKNVEVAYYELAKKAYKTKKFPDSGEVVSFTGSFARFEGKPMIHSHIAIAGPDFTIYGGHLISAETSLSLEVFIFPLSMPIQRHIDPVFNAVKSVDWDAK